MRGPFTLGTRINSALMALIVGPPHTRTEGRSPVWDSEFTTNAATLKVNSTDFGITLKTKAVHLPACVVFVVPANLPSVRF
jgi:hypothetical protein